MLTRVTMRQSSPYVAIDFPSASSKSSRYVVSPTSILLGEEERRRAPVRLRDDPDLHARPQGVGRQDAEPLPQGEFVLVTIGRAQLAPVAGRMAGKELVGGLARGLKRPEGAWCRHDESQLKD